MFLSAQPQHGVYSSAELTMYLQQQSGIPGEQSLSILGSESDGSADSEDYTSTQQRTFIQSILKEEKDIFRRLLPLVDLAKSVDSCTPLIWAIQRDQQWAIREIFKSAEIIDFRDHMFRGRTVLHLVAEKGYTELFRLLLSKDAQSPSPTLDVNAVDRERCTALFRAATVGDAEIVNMLLLKGADPNITNRDDISPLLVAAHRGHLEVVQQLLSSPRTNTNSFHLNSSWKMQKSAAIQKSFDNQRMNDTVHDFLNLSTCVGYSSGNTDGGNPLFSDAFWDELFPDDSVHRKQENPSSNISRLQRPRSRPHPATASFQFMACCCCNTPFEQKRAQKALEEKMAQRARQIILDRLPRWPKVIGQDLIALVSGYIRIHCLMDPPDDLARLCSLYTMSEVAAKEHRMNTQKARLNAWEYEGGHTRRNLRTLIETLPHVLPDELLERTRWKRIFAANTTAKLKRSYFFCIRVVHPESSQRKDCPEWQVICDYVFQALEQSYKAEVV